MPSKPFEIELNATDQRSDRPTFGKTRHRLAIEALSKAPVGASIFVPTSALAMAKSGHGTLASACGAVGGTGWASVRAQDGGWRVWKVREPKFVVS